MTNLKKMRHCMLNPFKNSRVWTLSTCSCLKYIKAPQNKIRNKIRICDAFSITCPHGLPAVPLALPSGNDWQLGRVFDLEHWDKPSTNRCRLSSIHNIYDEQIFLGEGFTADHDSKISKRFPATLPTGVSPRIKHGDLTILESDRSSPPSRSGL